MGSVYPKCRPGLLAGQNRLQEDDMAQVIKIMVVDDEASICRNVEKILTKNNYQVTCANSAREALEKMQDAPNEWSGAVEKGQVQMA